MKRIMSSPSRMQRSQLLLLIVAPGPCHWHSSRTFRPCQTPTTTQAGSLWPACLHLEGRQEPTGTFKLKIPNPQLDHHPTLFYQCFDRCHWQCRAAPSQWQAANARGGPLVPVTVALVPDLRLARVSLSLSLSLRVRLSFKFKMSLSLRQDSSWIRKLWVSGRLRIRFPGPLYDSTGDPHEIGLMNFSIRAITMA